MFKHIGYKILLAVGASVVLGMLAISIYFNIMQNRSVMDENRRGLGKTLDTAIQGVRSIMIDGNADIAQLYADNLKRVADIRDFRVLRIDGTEAFRDNSTIDNVNTRIGDEEFDERDEETTIRVIDAESPEFQRVLNTGELVSYYEANEDGVRYLTYIAPLRNDEDCISCHGSDHEFRGVVKLTSSLAELDRDLEESWQGSIYILAALTITLLVLIGLLIRKITLSILMVAENLEQISSGESGLGVRMDVRGRDETARLSAGFNRFVQNLGELFKGLSENIHSLHTMASSLDEISHTTNHQVEQQREGARQFVAESNRLSEIVEQVVERAQSGLDTAITVESETDRSRAMIEGSFRQYEDLAQGIGEVDRVISELSVSAGQVEHILQVIRDIADQTNLLALNASIEAARAGDRGRGFAVVAEEVRNLATRTRDSVGEIDTIVHGLETRSAAATAKARDINRQATESMGVAAQAQEALDRIGESARSIRSANTEIVSIAASEAEVSDRLQAIIRRQEEITVETSETARLMAERSEELKATADRLNSDVKRFE